MTRPREHGAPPRLGRASADPGRRASAYEQIKDAILGGTLRPMDRITEGDVASRLGLSRTPVREAIECVRNRRLKALVGQLQGQVHRARLLWPSTRRRLEETWKEHAELVLALRARDPDKAEQVMRTHLERARASTLDRMLPVTR